MKNFSGITDNLDITTKKYVDDGLAEKANSSDLATKVNKSGDTMTGSLTIQEGNSINVSQYNDAGGTSLMNNGGGLATQFGSSVRPARMFSSIRPEWYKNGASQGVFALTSDIPDVSGKLSKTENTGVSVLGTTKSTTTLGGNQLVAPNGIIFSGTAANAGLVTRGICGVSTPDSKGACSKDNLYINYDGNNTYNTGRMLILQAGETGTNYGNNMYQYAVPRGDIVKAWVEAQGYAKISDIPDVSGKANLSGANTFSGNNQFDGEVILSNRFEVANSGEGQFVVGGGVKGVRIDDVADGDVPLVVGTDAGTSGQVLTSQGAGNTPIWTTPSGGDNSKHGYTELTNEDLNTILTPGWYRAARNHSCENIPIASPNEFILIVESSSPNYIQQTFYNIGVLSQYYIRYTNNGGTSWSGAGWYTYQLVGTAVQTFSGRKTFSNGINLNNSLQVGGSSGTTGQFLMSQGGSTPKWSSIQVKVNGTTYTADSDGLIDLGTISGGGSASTSQYNDIY